MPGDEDRYQQYLTVNVMRDLDGQICAEPMAGFDQKTVLINEYMALRQKRYEATCYLVGLDMYTASKATCDYTGDRNAMNRNMWSGCQDIPENIVARDSVARYTPNIIGSSTRRDLSSMGAFSCAVTGSTNVYAICDKMNFKENMCPFREKGSYYRGADGFKNDPYAKGYTGEGRFDQLLLSGKICPGDRVSFPNGGASESGYHERTLISVDRDADGKITGYTIQANNPLELSHHKVPDNRDRLNGQTVIYASTSQFARDQFQSELEMLNGMTTEEIAQLLQEEKFQTAQTIVDIADKERCLESFGEGYKIDPKFAAQYPGAYKTYADFTQYQQDWRTHQIMTDDFNHSRELLQTSLSGQQQTILAPTTFNMQNRGRE